MAFTSQLYPGEVIHDDSTPTLAIAGPFGTGLDLSRRGPGGYAGVAEMFPQELLIPRSEWQARIKEMEERKSRLSDLVELAGLPCKNQSNTSYCWINAPTHCLEIVRVLQNQEMVILSPASAGAPIKGFRNVGGWGKEGLEWIIEHGVCPVSRWPANAIDRQYYTAENKAIALNYRVLEWWELTPRNLDQQVSLLLRRCPLAVGQSHWSHEITHYDPVWLDGEIAIRGRNSWGMDWPNPGARGYFIQRGSKMLADDAVAPRVALAA